VGKGIDEQQQQRTREATFYLFGRFGVEIEHLANAQALEPMALAAGVGELLLHQGQWNGHRVPSVPSSRGYLEAGQRSRVVAEMESSEQPHSSGARTKDEARPKTGKTSKSKVNRRFTPEGLEKIRASTKERWAAYRKAGKNLNGTKPSKSKPAPKKKMSKEQMEKQRVYAMRHAAKKRGETLPPLPVAVAS
jgi:hypothetical protein